MAAVLLCVVAGLLLVTLSHPRLGMGVVSAAAALAAALRAVLPESMVGVLAVRSRTFDVLFLLALAGLVAVLVVLPW